MNVPSSTPLRARLLRPSPWWWVIGGVGAVVVLSLVAFLHLHHPRQVHTTFTLLELGVILVGLTTVLGRRQGLRKRSGETWGDAAGLHWDGALLVPRAYLRDAIAYSNGEGREAQHGVRLRARSEHLSIELSSRDEAEALVRDLGLGAGQTAVHFDTSPGLFVFPPHGVDVRDVAPRQRGLHDGQDRSFRRVSCSRSG